MLAIVNVFFFSVYYMDYDLYIYSLVQTRDDSHYYYIITIIVPAAILSHQLIHLFISYSIYCIFVSRLSWLFWFDSIILSHIIIIMMNVLDEHTVPSNSWATIQIWCHFPACLCVYFENKTIKHIEYLDKYTDRCVLLQTHERKYLCNMYYPHKDNII